MRHNELRIREALRGRPRDRIRISVKFGALRDMAGSWTGIDARPVAVKNFTVSRCDLLDISALR
jgi:pyridoxine 4-dehydrogenase